MKFGDFRRNLGQSSRAEHWSNISSWQGGSGGFVLSEDAEDPFPCAAACFLDFPVSGWMMMFFSADQDDDGNFHAILHNLEGPHMVRGYREARVGIHAFSPGDSSHRRRGPGSKGAPCRRFLGFWLGACWNRLGETVKTRKKRGKNGRDTA